MSDKEDPTSNIPANALLKKLLAQDPTSLMTLRGYVGPCDAEGYVKLYASAEDLSQSVEILETDIVHYEEAPKEELPFGAVVVWIKKDSDVRHEISNSLKGSQIFGAAEDIISKGRLRMRLGPGLMKRGRSDVCISLCLAVCTSDCSQQCTNPCSSVCAEGPSRPGFSNRGRWRRFWT